MSLLLRWLMGLIGLQPAVPNNDVLGAGDRGLMLRVGVDDDNVPIHALMEGRCEDLEPGDRAIGVVVGVDGDGKQIIAWSKQRCEDETSNLEIGKRYIGLVVGVDDDGVQIIASFCKAGCEGIITLCRTCEVCCTLDATVSVPLIGDPTSWSPGIDITLTCGETFTSWGGANICFTEDDSQISCIGEITYGERDHETMTILGVDYVITSHIWKSEEFTYNGVTYRLIMYTGDYTYDPNHRGCELWVVLQKQIDTGDCGLQWCNHVVFFGLDGGLGSSVRSPYLLTQTTPEGGECPEGYASVPWAACPTPTSTAVDLDEDPDDNLVDCPIYVNKEVYGPLGFSDKKAWIQIFDNCEA